ncbi:hypothetical protein KY285_010577 [Solanum tuberosum]|nr:hypothetical protein KY289_012768 [Solanum tuberosum]KAH0734870.1 hypothetical protein KY285_010577 [Solanum tuberosum]
MELSMSSAGKDMAFVHDPRKGRDKQEPKRWSKFVPKNDNKESMNVNVSPVKFTTKEGKKQSVRTNFQARSDQKLILREKKIVLDDEKASSKQISITFGSLDPVQIWRRCNKSSLRKESCEQPIRKKMVKKLAKQKSIKRPKKAKVEVHHYQKPRHPVTLEEFLPSWLRTKST